MLSLFKVKPKLALPVGLGDFGDKSKRLEPCVLKISSYDYVSLPVNF